MAIDLSELPGTSPQAELDLNTKDMQDMELGLKEIELEQRDLELQRKAVKLELAMKALQLERRKIAALRKNQSNN